MNDPQACPAGMRSRYAHGMTDGSARQKEAQRWLDLLAKVN